jgi:hypothetical protein
MREENYPVEDCSNGFVGYDRVQVGENGQRRGFSLRDLSM